MEDLRGKQSFGNPGIIPPNQWRHVAGNENPADLITRGATVDKLTNCSLLWSGPEWLSTTDDRASFPPPDLEAYLATIRRFTSRRCCPAQIHSDQGTNFKAVSKMFQSVVDDQYAAEGVEWHFIPPGSPHFGGLWEAGVKSVKRHMQITIGKTQLTFEEFYTVLVQVEACLNSRPLCPLTENPTDLEPLTPGHFLTGAALKAVPVPEESSNSLRGRWQHLQQTVRHFWQRWFSEYLSSLQARTKWQDDRPNFQVGDLILLKSENLPPLNRPLGRITEIHPGRDQRVRAVTLRTASGIYQRPITKLVRLPYPCAEENSSRGPECSSE